MLLQIVWIQRTEESVWQTSKQFAGFVANDVWANEIRCQNGAKPCVAIMRQGIVRFFIDSMIVWLFLPIWTLAAGDDFNWIRPRKHVIGPTVHMQPFLYGITKLSAV